MPRPSVRFLAAALCTVALGGCGMLGDVASTGAPAASAGADAAGPSPMAPDVDASLRQMQLMRAGNDMVGATRIISQLMLVYPDDPRVVGEYGKLLVQQNRSADAVQFLRRAIELQPNEWSFYSALGVAFDQQNDLASAKLSYEKALSLKPGEPAVLNNYAMSAMLSGDTATARMLLLKAKANGSTDPKVDRNLALLDQTAPAAAAFPAPAPRKAVASVEAAPLPAPARGAPRPLASNGVVMQAVPLDPLAGPVAPRKPSKVAKAAAHKPAKVAATVKPPAKKTKPATDRIPALRMTADAGKP